MMMFGEIGRSSGSYISSSGIRNKKPRELIFKCQKLFLVFPHKNFAAILRFPRTFFSRKNVFWVKNSFELLEITDHVTFLMWLNFSCILNTFKICFACRVARASFHLNFAIFRNKNLLKTMTCGFSARKLATQTFFVTLAFKVSQFLVNAEIPSQISTV
jgi:hypothetical protein